MEKWVAFCTAGRPLSVVSSFIIAALHPSAAISSREACCLLINAKAQAMCTQVCSISESFRDSCQTSDGERGHARTVMTQ